MRRIRTENINTIENWNNMYRDERLRGHIRTNDGIWDKFLGYLEDGKSIVDVGCGTGGFLIYMKKHRPAMKTVGIDHSEEAHKYAELLCPDADLHYDFKSVMAKYWGYDKFDYALATEVMEHIDDNVGFMQEIIKLVKIDGLIITTTPYQWSDGEKYHVWDYESSFDILDLTLGKCELVNTWVFSCDMCVVMRKVAD